MTDLEAVLRKAEGSRILPTVGLGMRNAEEVCLMAADRIAELETENTRLKAELEILEADLTTSYRVGVRDAKADKWQSMKTAPRDSTKILAFWPDFHNDGSESFCTTYADDGLWHTPYDDAPFWSPCAPTHWQPLPSAPKGELDEK